MKGEERKVTIAQLLYCIWRFTSWKNSRQSHIPSHVSKPNYFGIHIIISLLLHLIWQLKWHLLNRHLIVVSGLISSKHMASWTGRKIPRKIPTDTHQSVDLRSSALKGLVKQMPYTNVSQASSVHSKNNRQQQSARSKHHKSLKSFVS